MMSKKSPQLRFEGFTDDWEQRKFQWLIVQNIIDSPIDGNHGEKHPKSSDYVESGIPFLMAKDIKNNKIDIKNCTFISKETAEALDKGFAKNGDILLTHKATIGEVGILEGVNTEYAMLTPQITYYRILDFSRLDRNFFSSVLRSSVFQKNIHKIAKQSTRPYVGITEQRKLTIYFPIKIEEQQKIGSFFKQIDETIALHQRKLDLLKEQKKGFLQKMFPKNGAKVPELRFAGFADDWEERKLKDVVEKQIKGKAQFEKLAQGDVEYLDTSRLNGGQAILTNGLKDVTLDDILILWDGSKAGTVYHGFEGALGSTLKAYRTSANSKFVYQYLKRHQDNIYNNYRTPNIPHVQKDFLNVFTISVPGSDEQAKIGSFFKKLDDTIALHQRKLDLLKEQKKGFLQKMFV